MIVSVFQDKPFLMNDVLTNTNPEISIYIAVCPVAIDKKVPHHNNDHRKSNSKVIAQEFCVKEEIIREN